MNSQSNTIRAAEWDIHYTLHHSSKGDGPSLILLHGGLPGSSGEIAFEHNIAVLSEQFNTYVLDFPGWGRSSKNLVPANEWRNPLAEAGRSVLAFMDAIGLEKAHLMGNSFGGSAALYAAMQAPTRIDRLVLLAPGGGLLPDISAVQPALHKLLGYYLGEGPSLDKFESLAQHMVLDPTMLTVEWLHARFEASIDPAVLANPPLRMPPGVVPPPDAALCRDPRLAQLRSPVLFLWGLNDSMQPVQCLPSFHSIPIQDAVLFGQCGHWPQREHASKVNELVTWFLNRTL